MKQKNIHTSKNEIRDIQQNPLKTTYQKLKIKKYDLSNKMRRAVKQKHTEVN